MTPQAYLDAIAADSRRIAELARRDLDADVPSCPGWTVRDLVEHTGAVHRHKLEIVEHRLHASPEVPGAPTDGLIEWFEEGAARLVEVLAATDPATEVWTWDEPNQHVGFWYRRMAHETAIHRADAELAFGTATPIDTALAADGIDEVVTAMLTGVPAWGEFAAGPHTAALTTSDTDDRWALRLGRFHGTSPATGTTYDLSAAEQIDADVVDVTVHGTASDVLLWVWGRGDLATLVVDGDNTVAEAVRHLAAEATA